MEDVFNVFILYDTKQHIWLHFFTSVTELVADLEIDDFGDTAYHC